MLDVAQRWTGDLQHLSMRTWWEDSDIAALVVVQDGEVSGWTNLRHVHLEHTRIVWLWIRHAALFRPPVDVLYAVDLAILAWDDRRAQES